MSSKWWHMLVIPALRRLRQDDVYIERYRYTDI
jgi:hypothetical protein